MEKIHIKNVLIFCLLVAISIGGGLYFSPEFRKESLPEDSSTGEAQIGGTFSLTDQNGKIRTDTEFRGKYMLVFFGFTNCPSICPPGMMNITQAMETLGDEAKNIVPLFITVDPKRDTPEQMKKFLGNFHPAFIGLTGETKPLESAYKVYSSKVEAKDQPDGYMMDHSGFIYLMDKDGKYLKHFTYDAEPKQMADGIEEAMQ